MTTTAAQRKGAAVPSAFRTQAQWRALAAATVLALALALPIHAQRQRSQTAPATPARASANSTATNATATPVPAGATAVDALLADRAQLKNVLDGGALRACYSVNGAGNNPQRPSAGASGGLFSRLTAHGYRDGVSAMPRTHLNARNLSNALQSAGCSDVPNSKCASDMLWVFGQFVAHDLSLSPDGGAAMTIPIPASDPHRMGSIHMTRSRVGPGTSPHQQMTFTSAFLDLSQVYGSDRIRADALREMTGGRLKTARFDGEEFLPLGVRGADGSAVLNTQPPDFPNAGTAAGDMRATEHDALFVLQVLFVRNHNRLARALSTTIGSAATDEAVYQAARALNIAQYQAVVFQEFLPMLLGSSAPGAFRGFNPAVSVEISNEFATAAFRLGHSLVGCEIKGFDESGRVTDSFPIADSFFTPTKVMNAQRFNAMLRGLVLNTAQEMDLKISDSLRNRLFAHGAGSAGLDLSAIDVERGRDHGLPDFGPMRTGLGLSATPRLSGEPGAQALAAASGGDVSRADPWLGMLAEQPVGSSMIGESGSAVIARQFEVLRDGDRCFFQNTFARHSALLRALQHDDLLALMRANTGVKLPRATSAFRNPNC